nr:hypothetical protein [Bacillus altitudinis]
MQRVTKKQTPSNTMLLSKAIGLVILTLILFFIWDMSKTNMHKQQINRMKCLRAVHFETQVQV